MAVVKINLYNNRILSCVLLTGVKNTSYLKKQLITGKLKCALVKPSLIVDLFQLSIAANKSVLADSLGKLTTKSVYTEILFNLSISKNISQSLVKFGIDDTDSDLLVLSFGDDSEVADIIMQIEGDTMDMAKLKDFTNENVVRKTYKISDSELSASSLINLVVSKISTKDFVNF
ncbi:hypothetical protein J6590_037707 [Homalodisca vitripennis]|nr:hypothetical protein J6590_037707 [Homalodisca vitripennis]